MEKSNLGRNGGPRRSNAMDSVGSRSRSSIESARSGYYNEGLDSFSSNVTPRTSKTSISSLPGGVPRGIGTSSSRSSMGSGSCDRVPTLSMPQMGSRGSLPDCRSDRLRKQRLPSGPVSDPSDSLILRMSGTSVGGKIEQHDGKGRSKAILSYALPGEGMDPENDEELPPSLVEQQRYNSLSGQKPSAMDEYLTSCSLKPSVALQPHRSIRGHKGMLGGYRGKVTSSMSLSETQLAALPPRLITEMDAVARGTIFMKAEAAESNATVKLSIDSSTSLGGYDFVALPAVHTVSVLRLHSGFLPPEP